jgi:hypothetical protein
MWIEYISNADTLEKVAVMLESFDEPVKFLYIPMTPATFFAVAGYFFSAVAAIVINFVQQQFFG